MTQAFTSFYAIFPIIVGSFFEKNGQNEPSLMSISVNPPELIISLSRDKVSLLLSDQPAYGRSSWKASYPVEGIFLADQVANALDTALFENPTLLDDFQDVTILVVDRPNVCIPEFYAGDEVLPQLAGRYLKIRAGDTLSADATSGEIAIAYSVPTGTINLLKEYYAKADHLHMTTLLWNAISQLVLANDESSKLFLFATGNTLFILGVTSGKLNFSRNFYIREQADVVYFALACSRLLRSAEHWLLTIKDEESVSIDREIQPYFKIHHQLELPELQTLIARQKSCGS